MNEAQYHCTLRNGRRRSAARLGDSLAAMHVLRRAARATRRCEQAQEAWQRIARTEWLRQSSVLSAKDGDVVIAVCDPVLRHKLSGFSGRFVREISEFLSGVQRVCFVYRERGA